MSDIGAPPPLERLIQNLLLNISPKKCLKCQRLKEYINETREGNNLQRYVSGVNFDVI
jgi:hypothetical protein